MLLRCSWLFALAALSALVLATPAAAQIVEAPFPNEDCYAPAGDPEPGTAAWFERDTKNQICAALRNRDQLSSPAYGYAHHTAFPSLHLQALVEQAQDPTNPRGGITTLIPGARAADPFRTIERWTEAGRGTVESVSFPAQNGATLRGNVFRPPPSVPKPASGYPGVVITDGSAQGFQQLYFWAAQDLASNGYIAMTYDVQGQGDSDLAGDDCPDECSGVPYQQDYNFFQGAQDSLSFFLSSQNPASGDLDAAGVGIAGHSLGASAASEVGQCDERVKAIVAWDNLRAPSACNGATIPPAHRSDTLLDTPALGISNDYGFWTQPTFTPPDPEAKQGGFKVLAAAGVDTAQVVLRGATHLEYTYIPVVLPASRLGERFASHYTVAWFDRYLKGDASAFDRLTATEFDGGADATSIGAGDYSPEEAMADQTDPMAGNVPYEIEGMSVPNALSFYYRSAYSLSDPSTGGLRTCSDMTEPSACPLGASGSGEGPPGSGGSEPGSPEPAPGPGAQGPASDGSGADAAQCERAQTTLATSVRHYRLATRGTSLAVRHYRLAVRSHARSADERIRRLARAHARRAAAYYFQARRVARSAVSRYFQAQRIIRGEC